MIFEKYYEELGINCMVKDGQLKVTGADGRFHILQDLFSLEFLDFGFQGGYDIHDVKQSLEKVIGQTEDAKRVYQYTAFHEICRLEFGKKSKYVDFTVKYPLNSHVWLGKMQSGQVPIRIFYELLCAVIAMAPKQEDTETNS